MATLTWPVWVEKSDYKEKPGKSWPPMVKIAIWSKMMLPVVWLCPFHLDIPRLDGRSFSCSNFPNQWCRWWHEPADRRHCITRRPVSTKWKLNNWICKYKTANHLIPLSIHLDRIVEQADFQWWKLIAAIWYVDMTRIGGQCDAHQVYLQSR